MLPVGNHMVRVAVARTAPAATKKVGREFTRHLFRPPPHIPERVLLQKSKVSTSLHSYGSIEMAVASLAQSALVASRYSSASHSETSARAVTQQFSVVKSVRERLSERGCAIVYGAPGSGKTEQMSIACGKPYAVFDLRQEFYEYCLGKALKEEERTAGRVFSSGEVEEFDNKFWDSWKSGYEDRKTEELAWLRDNYDTIRGSLIGNKESVVILDEVDLVRGELEGPALKSALLIADLAKDLQEAGKKILITLHRAGVDQPKLMEYFVEKDLLVSPGDVVKTNFLSLREQYSACYAMGFSEVDAKRAIKHTEGVPGAYLHMLKRAEANMGYYPTYEEFIIDAHHQLEKNYRAVKKTSPLEVIALLGKMSRNHALDVEKEGVSVETRQALLDTGLVFLCGKKLIMPEAVRLVIVNQVDHSDNLSTVTKYELITGISKPVAFAKKNGNSSAEMIYGRTVHTVAKLGGGKILRMKDSSPIIVPSVLSLLHMIHGSEKKAAAAFLDITGRLPEERTTTDHLLWRNTASSVDELLTMAHSLKEPFLAVLEASCGGVGEVYTGPAHRFLFKHKASLERKVALWSAESGIPESKAIATLNDSIRATVILHDLKGMKSAIESFYKIAEEKGWKVVFSDKFKENYESGYVAVHAKVLIPGEFGAVMGEVQFHLKDIHDGSTESIKELSHKALDDYTRLLVDPLKREEMRAQLEKDWGVAGSRIATPIELRKTVLGIVQAAQKTLFTTGLIGIASQPILK